MGPNKLITCEKFKSNCNCIPCTGFFLICCMNINYSACALERLQCDEKNIHCYKYNMILIINDKIKRQTNKNVIALTE